MTRSTLCAIIISVCVLTNEGHAQLITGSVREQLSNEAVQGAVVQLLNAEERNLGEIQSNEDGQFAVRVPAPGYYRLSVSRVGFTPARSDLFLVGPQDEPSVNIYLTATPITLDTVDVVSEIRAPQLESAGFYDRLEDGIGTFIFREEIEGRSPGRVTDLFYGRPGIQVQIVSGYTGERDVIMRQGNRMFFGSVCYPTVVLDGVVVRTGGKPSPGSAQMGSGVGGEVGLWNELIHPSEIEAIEAYPSPLGLPAQYGGSRSPCGAILIWTRR